MNKTLKSKAYKVLLLDEGKRNKPYKDSKGLWTIGIGRLIGAKLEDLTLSDYMIGEMFAEDIDKHWAEACDIFGAEFLAELEDARQIAILSLLFTLGKTKFLTFTSTIPAIKAKDWDRAAALLMSSKWAKDVDPRQLTGKGRDDRIAQMLKSGKFPKDYGIWNE
jgi:lysozyme